MWSTIGFEQQKKQFTQAIADGSLGHAYLFTGPEMIGKKKFALELFALLNGRELTANEPDIRLFAPRIEQEESKIYIDDVRGLKNFALLTAQRGPYKYIVIDDADTLTADASNALLKILEEPPAKTVLVLVSSRSSQLLPTITSRCQEIRFQPHSPEIIEQVLSEHRVVKEDRELLAMLADGRIGWALNICREKRLDDIKKIISEFQSVLRQGTFERMQYAKKMTDAEDYPEKINIWLRYARTHGKDPVKTRLVLKSLIQLSYLVSQPQYNHRLAIENFLINI